MAKFQAPTGAKKKVTTKAGKAGKKAATKRATTKKTSKKTSKARGARSRSRS